MGDPKDGMDVHIKVDGQRLTEYIDDDDEDPPHTITKYVIAQSGAHFAVAYKFDPNFVYREYDLLLGVHLDGHEAYNAVFYPSGFKNRSQGAHTEIAASRSYQDGKFWERKFTFADLMIDESGEKFDATKKKAIDALGDITIKMWRVKVTSKSKPPMSNDLRDFEKLKQDAKVPEKAIKGRAVSHQSKLGQLQVGSSYKSVDVSYIDPLDTPFAVYSFQYRSKEALKSMCLIPRTPEPVPLEERPIDDLTPEEMRELLRRQRDRSEQARVIKRETRSETIQPKPEPGRRSQWEDGDDLAFIEDRSAKRRRIGSDEPIETVDLTGD